MALRPSVVGCVAGSLAACAFAWTVNAQQPAASATAPEAAPRAFVTRYCISCHNDRVKRGGLALEAVAAHDVAQSPDVWESVLRKVRARQMPPVGTRRPDEATYEAAIASLETALDRAAAAAPNPGRTATLRRLNRTEYQNAIRDLLALDVDVASLLPADESSHGFDNVTVGDLSPTLLDRYIAAAQKISRLAVGRPSRSPGGETIRIPADLTQEEHVDGLPLGTRGGALVRYTFPLDGEYEIQIRLTRDRNEHVEGLSEPHELEVLARSRARAAVHREAAARVERSADDAQPTHANVDEDLKVRIPVKAGPHALGVTFLKNPSALLETKRQPYQAHFNMYRHPRHPAGDLLGLDHRPVRGEGSGRHAQPPPDLRDAGRAKPRRRGACAKRILADADAPRLPAAGHRRRICEGPLRVLPAGARGGGLRRGHRDGAVARCW